MSGAEVVAISDAVPDSAQRLAAEVGVDTIHEDGLELIAADDVDAVVIASPAITHEPFTLACLEAGKPVLCEKPLAIDAEASLRVVEAEAALGRRLVTVGFMRRYDPGYVDLKAQARRRRDRPAGDRPLRAPQPERPRVLRQRDDHHRHRRARGRHHALAARAGDRARDRDDAAPVVPRAARACATRSS